MQISLTDFLLELAQDPDEAARFMANPTTTMTQAGLSEADQEILLSKDPQKIKDAVNQHILAGSFIVFISVTTTHVND